MYSGNCPSGFDDNLHDLYHMLIAWVVVENVDHLAEDAEHAKHIEPHDALWHCRVILDTDVLK